MLLIPKTTNTSTPPSRNNRNSWQNTTARNRHYSHWDLCSVITCNPVEFLVFGIASHEDFSIFLVRRRLCSAYRIYVRQIWSLSLFLSLSLSPSLSLSLLTITLGYLGISIFFDMIHKTKLHSVMIQWDKLLPIINHRGSTAILFVCFVGIIQMILLPL